jgi:penicillin amidase
MRRALTRASLAALGLAVVSAVAAYVYFRQSLPTIDGSIGVAGITAPVEIVRDADAIPHILGATREDALFGLGYVHAQDRLWQMEFQRRIGFGRLSEIFGDVTVPEDRFLRTVGFGRAARAAWAQLPSDARAAVEAYIGGVNAFIGAHRGRQLPPEFTLLRIAPEPWSGPDVLVWVKMMAWDLSENYRFELMRRDLSVRVGHERVAELMPPYPDDALTILSGGPAVAGRFGPASPPRHAPGAIARAAGALWSDRFADTRGAHRPEGLGSNNWVVDGTLTASGRPLLANDPHLGTQIPSLWYLAHLSAPDFDVAGATLPGLPAVAIGRNRFIAWGETNVGADVQDLYIERLDEVSGTAEFRGLQEPLRLTTETIAVKGGPSVAVTVRSTRHGPIVSDALNANDGRAEPLPPLALRWTALDDDDRTLAAFLRLNQARNWTEFTSALRDLVSPSQNFVYADTAGHIGYYASGRIPVRSLGDGSVPVPGWDGQHEWSGWVPFDELPHAYDPPSHFIVTANNRPAPGTYPHLIALEYPNPYRAERITELVRSKGELTPDDFRAIQADTRSPHARALVPLLLAHVEPESALDRQAAEALRAWNFEATEDSAAAAIFEAWFLQLAPAIVGDELGDALRVYQGRFSYITRFLASVLRGAREGSDPAESPWCDDTRTPMRESCTQVVTRALHDGVLALSRTLGGDPKTWRWDAAHRVRFPHQGFDPVPALRRLFSRSMPNGGDWSTVNVGGVDAGRPFEQTAIPGYRQILDLSPAADNRFIDAVGQSGHVLSRHYDDFLEDWHEVRHRRMRTSRDDIERGAMGHLRLVPAGASR